MACSHPLIGRISIRPDGKKHVQIVSVSKVENYDLSDGTFIRIPCGHCMECRLDYARSWADRMILELASNKGKGVFVTLTYRDSELHFTPSGLKNLDKRDCQLFFKRLRKFCFGKKIRYYLAGEYGPTTQRPHYHAIIYGLSLVDFPDLIQIGRNDLMQPYFTSKIFESIWSHGFIVLSEVSYQTCGYVARYCTKKLSGSLRSVYGDRLPEFSLVSRSPGLGSGYLVEHPDLFDYSRLYVSGTDRPISIPSYFLRKLDDPKSDLYNPDLYAKIKSDRLAAMCGIESCQGLVSDKSVLQRLGDAHDYKAVALSALSRSAVDSFPNFDVSDVF